MPLKFLLLLSLVVGFLGASPARAATDSADIETRIRTLLVDFHTYNSDPARHAAFWAEDLIYTSSAGAVRTKPLIMESTRAASAKADPSQPAAKYAAEDVKVRYPDGRVLRYRNSGTFVPRENRWQAVAWQATAIPAPAK
jgi:hypothetical protein